MTAIMRIVVAVLCFLPFGILSQSSCGFLRETPFDLSNVTEKPQKNSELLVCRPRGPTCCTAAIEAEMPHYARLGVDRFVHDHIVLLRRFFDDFARDFRAHFRDAIRSSQQQLNKMFIRTYGNFYEQNSKIFADFFDQLDEQFAVEEERSAIKATVAALFRRIFHTEFSLMNPLKPMTDSAKHCMSRLQTQLRPFASIPTKLAIQLERAFNAWKWTTISLERVSVLLINVADRLTISDECMDGLVRLRECHVCSGVSPAAKPCLGFCLNILRGCYAEAAELESQWDDFLDSLQQMSSRLKGAGNPYAVFAPLPVQISEAIMTFQEKGQTLSNRIIFQCFEPMSIRTRRNADAAVIMPKDNTTNELAAVLDAEYRKANNVKKTVSLFSDRLSRMKGAWRLLPTAICSDGQIAAPIGDQCWNGDRLAVYRKPIVMSGVYPQKRNPEYSNLQITRERFINERIKLATLAREINSLYEGRVQQKKETIEGSALEDLFSPDDEDSNEGSAYEREENNEYNDPEDLVNIHLLEQRGQISSATTFNINPNNFIVVMLLWPLVF